MNKKTAYVTKAAVIAAVYTALTYAAAMVGLAYGQVQFRFSEALTILPLFTPAAIPGLTVGCVLGNLLSPEIGGMDIVFGSLATLLAALCTRALRGVTIKGYPLLSMLAPVLFNGVIVGAEIAWVTAKNVFWQAYGPIALSVAAGEAAVVFILGTALFYVIKKDRNLQRFIN